MAQILLIVGCYCNVFSPESYTHDDIYNWIAVGTVGRLAFQETRQNKEFLSVLSIYLIILGKGS
jgi:hypothetical protein